MCQPPISCMDEHVHFDKAVPSLQESPISLCAVSHNKSSSSTSAVIRLGHVLSRHGRAFAVTVLLAAYLGHQANHSNEDAMSSSSSSSSSSRHHYNNLTKLILRALNQQHDQEEHETPNISIINIQSWWVVAYALIVYMMFGGWRWWIQRKLSKLTKATSSVIAQVASRETLTKIRSSVSMRTMQQFLATSQQQLHQLHLQHQQQQHQKRHDDEKYGKRTLTLSVDACFVNETLIGSMSLRDMRDVFQYVFQCSAHDFTKDSYVAKLREPARQTIESLEGALALSRGERVTAPTHHHKSSEYGTAVDALAFVGLCRIFAEWMPMRLVPEGYGGRYAFGINLARRDMIGNIAKVEKAIHAYLDEKVMLMQQQQQHSSSNNGTGTSTVYSPSIREILEYEIATNKIPHPPKLGGNTAALGILWLKRQLEYQGAIFSNASEIPVRFPDSKAAGRAAYEQVYGAYHGFIVKQIFQNSFDAAPSTHLILQHMNLVKLQNINEGDEVTVDEENDEDDMWIHLPMDQDSVRSLRPIHQQHHQHHAPAHPVLDFLGSVIKEHTTKFGHLLGSCIGLEGHQHASLNVLSSPSKISMGGLEAAAAMASSRALDELDNVDKDAFAFLFTLRPFLHGLNNLIEELTLNDPTKV